VTAEAYSVSQEFPAAARREFVTDRHYLLYSAAARAALIAAGRPVHVTLPQSVTACSVLYDATFIAHPPTTLTVVNMSPLARELILHCRNWTNREKELDPYARQIFLTLAVVVAKLATTPSRASIPVPTSRGLAQALALTEQRIAGTPDFATIAAEVAMTPRSLARYFANEMGMTWRQALRRLRMIRALELLAEESANISETAFAVGYASLSAFNSAFREFVGETPTAYRLGLRVAGEARPEP
jgi:AraC-like DNA-binding protein